MSPGIRHRPWSNPAHILFGRFVGQAVDIDSKGGEQLLFIEVGEPDGRLRRLGGIGWIFHRGIDHGGKQPGGSIILINRLASQRISDGGDAFLGIVLELNFPRSSRPNFVDLRGQYGIGMLIHPFNHVAIAVLNLIKAVVLGSTNGQNLSVEGKRGPKSFLENELTAGGGQTAAHGVVVESIDHIRRPRAILLLEIGVTITHIIDHGGLGESIHLIHHHMASQIGVPPHAEDALGGITVEWIDGAIMNPCGAPEFQGEFPSLQRHRHIAHRIAGGKIEHVDRRLVGLAIGFTLPRGTRIRQRNALATDTTVFGVQRKA